LDDLLEKQKENVTVLDLEYATLSVDRLMVLLKKTVSQADERLFLYLTRYLTVQRSKMIIDL